MAVIMPYRCFMVSDDPVCVTVCYVELCICVVPSAFTETAVFTSEPRKWSCVRLAELEGREAGSGVILSP